MTIQEIWIGIPLHQQQEMLDKGYTLQPHASGPRRTEYVMAVRDAGPACRIAKSISGACQIFGFTREELLGARQYRAIFQARAAGIWVCGRFGFSSTQIGSRFKRDPTTALDAMRRCEEMQSKDWGYRHACERLLLMVREAA